MPGAIATVLVLAGGAMWGLAGWLFWGLGTPYQRLALILDEYLQGLECGQPVEPDELFARHPDVADRLRVSHVSTHVSLRDAIDKLQVPEGMSVIARTAAIGRTLEELQRVEREVCLMTYLRFGSSGSSLIQQMRASKSELT